MAALIIGCLSPQLNRAFASDGCEKIANSDFTVVVMPDTQKYAESFPETYLAQTEWIKNSQKALDIRFVIHLGDIVEHAEAENEWRIADRAHATLDGAVAYSVLPGNHDMRGHNTKLYDKYFPPKRFQSFKWYGGHEGCKNENNFCTFEAEGMKFLVLSLEYGPSQKTLQWAGDIADSHPDCRVIVATHSYLNTKSRTPQGDAIWNELIRKKEHKNIFLVICGHVIGTNFRESQSDDSRTVYEMLVDYQGEPNGGDGWLRILRFSPRENKIFVRDYSPTLGKYKDGPASNFSLDYPMLQTAN